MISPSHSLWQLTWKLPYCRILKFNPIFPENTVKQVSNVQPAPYVIVTQYSPPAKSKISCVIAPFDHKYVIGSVPPVRFRSIAPFPFSFTSCVIVAVTTIGAVSWITVKHELRVLPPLSVTVTQYVPGQRFVIVPVVCGGTVFHTKVYGPVPKDADAVIDPSQT